ncbi:MAG: cation:proton antiporter [Gammaproteobacteria bacterium]|nr:cation:proton antiporter [Gammaproteobacteria bacterium]
MSELVVVVVAGALVSWFARRTRQPGAVWLIVAGMLLGPPGLGVVNAGGILEGLSELGVALVVGAAGLRFSLAELARAGRPGVMLAVVGALGSLAAGYAVCWGWSRDVGEALYVGIALAATSIAVTLSVFEQLGLLARRVALIVLAAAVADDVIALYLLSAAHGVLSEAGGLLDFLIVNAVTLVIPAMIYVSSSGAARMFGIGAPRESGQQALIVTAVIVAAAWIAEAAGSSAVVGAFFGGAGLGAVLGSGQRERTVAIVEPIVLFLLPFFFIGIGAQVEWMAFGSAVVWTLAVALAVTGLAAKAVGGWWAVRGALSGRDRWIAGFAMVPRGEIALIVAGLGLEQGHLSHHVFVAVVIAIIALTLAGPLALQRLVADPA